VNAPDDEATLDGRGACRPRIVEIFESIAIAWNLLRT
jgi:hypothetical protein